MKANALLKHNIDTLLRGRGQTRKDLAQWCYRTESWISKIFQTDKREIPLKYLDRIADFFGLATYQLLQPGISPLTERRHGERRGGRDRRIGHAHRLMLGLGAALEGYRQPPAATGGKGTGPHAAAASPYAEELRRLSERYAADVSRLISRAESGRQTPGAGRDQPKAPPRRRAGRGRDDPKDS